MSVNLIESRTLGGSGMQVSALGLGCMSLSGIYGATTDKESLLIIHEALDSGITLLDTSDMYGWGHNEELVGKGIRGRRANVVLATKFGNLGGRDGKYADGRPEYVRAACEASLKRLGVDTIDLYYQHRVDPQVPIEDTVGAMAHLVEQGKIRAIGLSEARPETIRRASNIHPIAAVQNEFSLLYRSEAEETLRTTRELDIAFVAYSPLGRGLLTREIASHTALSYDDNRRRHPRFCGDNLFRNLELVQRIVALASRKRCTPSQLALSWLLAQGPDIIPIPGTKRSFRLRENLGALSVELTSHEISEIAKSIPIRAVAGERYPEPQMKSVYL